MSNDADLTNNDDPLAAPISVDMFASTFKKTVETLNHDVEVLEKTRAKKVPYAKANTHKREIETLERAVLSDRIIVDAVGKAYAESVFTTYVDWDEYQSNDDYADKTLKPKQKNKLKPNKGKQTEPRFGYPDKFWRWAHRKKKKEMSRNTGRKLTIDDVEPSYQEWSKLPPHKQDAYEIAKPMKKPVKKK